jgi:NAD(P) transhydrogenase
MDEEFRLVVIGAGPAGEKAAAQAAYFGHRTAIVERSDRPGGTTALNGGVPTKTLRETALYVSGFQRRSVYGVGMELDLQTEITLLHARAAQVVDIMSGAVAQNIARHGIELIHGTARLAPGQRVVVDSADGMTRTLHAETILVATGSRPFHPPGIPFDDPDVLDSETVLELDRPFASIVVVGGGPIGVEFASIFAALGISVTLVDNAQRLLPFMDGEVSDLVATIFRRMGIDVSLQAGRASVDRDAAGLRVQLPAVTLRPEKILFAAGRVGNTEGLDLPAVGVATDDRGRIIVDAQFQTTVPGIYAAGDVIGLPALASVSMEQGRVAVCHALGIPFKETVDPLAPFGVYSIPEVAMVGMTEEAAAAAGIAYEVGRGWFEHNTRATISGATEGFVKLVFRRDDRRLLGVHIIGTSAGELIHLGQAVLHFGGTIDYFIHTTFNVPTETEAFKYAAYDGLQRLQATAAT